MDNATYESILRSLTIPISAAPHFSAIARLHGTSVDSIRSIYSQEVQSRCIRSTPVLRAHAPDLARRYLRGADMLALCYETDLPPCIVLRRIFEHLPLGLHAPKRATEALRNPSMVRTAAVAPQQAERALEDAGLASDESAINALLRRLELDIQRCVECDIVYSPSCDAARHRAGIEYEAKLYESLTKAGIAYLTEEALRSTGFHKTPDARLQVPVAVRGHVVCWIDSKATFGDVKTHRQQLKEQYQGYVNRFGPGLVIYWHGHLASLDDEDVGSLHEKEGKVLIMDRFPSADEIVALPRLPLSLGACGDKGDCEAADSLTEL